ncbi:MAG: DUF1963 domain-containing protein [Ruminococcus sp.]
MPTASTRCSSRSTAEPSSDSHEIMWGDSGICNFFIHSEALRNCDFSEVLYNWDCY